MLGLTDDLSVISSKPPTWLNTLNERERLFSAVTRFRHVILSRTPAPQNMSVIADALPAAPGKLESPSAFISVFSVF